MRNPIRAALGRFAALDPAILLIGGVTLSSFDAAFLYVAAARDGVLRINGGVGLLQNYGLASTLLGNAFLLFVVRRYSDAVLSARQAGAVRDAEPLDAPLAALREMLTGGGRYLFVLYLLLAIGAAFWISNAGSHVFGNPEARWGHAVFDSPDHRLTFYASRVHNLYTWLIVYPLLGYVVMLTSVQLRAVFASGDAQNALAWDLLHPDHRGGFLFVERAHLAFNLVVAAAYVQVTLHIGTFSRMNVEHAVAYVVATFLLIAVNRLFLDDIYSIVRRMRLDALNALKERTYGGDTHSFEILKYCYERRLDEFRVLNFAIKAGAIALSVAVKAAPLMKLLRGA